MQPSLINEHMLATLGELAATTPYGAIVEVGVYRGGSAEVLYKVATTQGRRIYLFDTFTGIPMQGPDDVHQVGDFSDGITAEEARRLFPEANVAAGVFPETLDYTGPVAFVHADADQYQSTKDICEYFTPRMVAGGCMVFDDYSLPGCRRAIMECFPEHDVLPDCRAIVRF